MTYFKQVGGEVLEKLGVFKLFKSKVSGVKVVVRVFNVCEVLIIKEPNPFSDHNQL